MRLINEIEVMKEELNEMLLIFLTLFFSIGIWMWISTDSVFYIFNFGYIGTSIAIGTLILKTLVTKEISVNKFDY